MIFIVIIAIMILMLFSVFIRTILLNLHLTLFYLPKDLYKYFKYHLFNEFQTGKLICYTALFGGGKTLSCVHYINHLYDRYNNKKLYNPIKRCWITQKVHVISNVDLKIPYEKFTSLSQVVRVAEKFKEIDEHVL